MLLAVIAQAQASTGFAGQLGVFAAYAAGSIALLLVLSAAAALAGAALNRWVRALAHQQARITAVLLVITGAYLAVYWWPAVTRRARVGHGLPSIDRWSAATSAWLQAHTAQAAVTAAVVLTLVLTAIVAARASRGKKPSRASNPHAVDGHSVDPAPEECCAPAPTPGLSARTPHGPREARGRCRVEPKPRPAGCTRRRTYWKGTLND